MRLPTLRDRSAGLLLHPSSLPGPGPNGELGPAAWAFADFLAAAGQRWWQMLPVGPTGFGDSPYSALSAFAGNPALVSRARLVDDGLLAPDDLARPREEAMRAALDAFRRRRGAQRAGFETFCEASRAWLDDYALYRALKRAYREREWTRWDPAHRDRAPAALAQAGRDLADDVELCRFEQHRFHLDWQALRDRCRRLGVALMGDLPIYVAHDSADVWRHRELFHLDARGEPTSVAGVPPDYFSPTGQRWGNPLYRWGRMRRSGYAWWIDRMRATLARFDAVRIDHFIGFVRSWRIPAGEPTAVRGRWVAGPGLPFFRALAEALGPLPLVAEDLGAVTPEVGRLRRRLGLPGIRVLQFAFGNDPQGPSFRPHNYPRRAVAYSGTHDNDTAVGWACDRGGPGTPRTEAQSERERRAALAYLGVDDPRAIHWAMIRALYASVARLVIVPVQDVLGLGSEARMNRPGTLSGNWRWRLDEDALGPALSARLRGLAEIHDRAGRAAAADAGTDRRDAVEARP